MPLFPVFLSKGFLQKTTFLLLGVLLGAAATTAGIGRQIDELTNSKQELEEKLGTIQEELKQVRNSFSQHQEPVITSLSIRVEFVDPKLFRLEESAIRLNIEKQIKEILKNLMGKKVKELDPALIPWMIENRLIVAEGHSFRIKVMLLVLGEKTYLQVQAQGVSNELK